MPTDDPALPRRVVHVHVPDVPELLHERRPDVVSRVLEGLRQWNLDDWACLVTEWPTELTAAQRNP